MCASNTEPRISGTGHHDLTFNVGGKSDTPFDISFSYDTDGERVFLDPHELASLSSSSGGSGLAPPKDTWQAEDIELGNLVYTLTSGCTYIIWTANGRTPGCLLFSFGWGLLIGRYGVMTRGRGWLG